MKIIKKLGNNKGLFLCPYCLKEVEKRLDHGKNQKSCGCHKGFKHGDSTKELYKTYYNMKNRCLNENNSDFKYYGGRGITICPEWANDYVVFRDWALNNGYQEGLEIDRRDTNGNYEPNNCRWVTHKVNSRNRVYCKITMSIAKNIRLDYKTGKFSQRGLSKKYNISLTTISNIILGKTWA